MVRRIDLNKIIEKEQKDNELLYSNLAKSNVEYSTIEKILMSKMTKYSILDNIIPSLEGKDVVNVLIDLNSVLNSIYNPTILDATNEFVKKRVNKTMLASYVINIIAHYKNWFISKRNKAVQVFAYYSFEDGFCSKDNIPFKDSYNEKYNSDKYSLLNNYVQGEFKTAEDILRFVPYCYLINTRTMVSDLMPMLIEKDNNGNEQTIILTNNKLAAINLDFSSNVSILDVKGIQSNYYDRTNIHEFVGVNDVSEEFYKCILKFYSITGFSKYNIPKISKITAKTIVSTVLDNEKYKEFYEKNSEKLNSNLVLLDFSSIVSSLTVEETNANFYGKLIDLDLNDVESINTDFLSRFPVNLDFLFKM